MILRRLAYTILSIVFCLSLSMPVHAWFDETHLAIARAAGYKKWFNAAAADLVRAKMGKLEGFNHFSNSPRGARITADQVLAQAARYDQDDPQGHLYGAIIGSFRAFRTIHAKGGFADVHLAFMVHYIGDLSMPLHHTMYNAFNRKYHLANDGIINGEVLNRYKEIALYVIEIHSEQDLAKEIARIANLSKQLGETLEDDHRSMTRVEAYRQIAHSASLLKAVLAYIRRMQ